MQTKNNTNTRIHREFSQRNRSAGRPPEHIQLRDRLCILTNMFGHLNKLTLLYASESKTVALQNSCRKATFCIQVHQRFTRRRRGAYRRRRSGACRCAGQPADHLQRSIRRLRWLDDVCCFCASPFTTFCCILLFQYKLSLQLFRMHNENYEKLQIAVIRL